MFSPQRFNFGGDLQMEGYIHESDALEVKLADGSLRGLDSTRSHRESKLLGLQR